MDLNVFNFKDYKTYLKRFFEENKKQRGLSKRMAEAANCQPSYLSQVLSTKAQLTMDQALGAAIFLNFNSAEQDYFLLLVNYERAVTKELQQALKNKITKIQEEQSDIGKKLSRTPPVNSEAMVKYFSSWLYSYIHLLTSIEAYQTLEAIAQKVFLPKEETLNYLQELENLNLVHKDGMRWIHTGKEIHIDSKSSLITYHHQNWRSQSMINAQKGMDVDSIHFSGVYSISKKDFAPIKEKITSLLKEVNQAATQSGSEEIAIFCCDYFRK